MDSYYHTLFPTEQIMKLFSYGNSEMLEKRAFYDSEGHEHSYKNLVFPFFVGPLYDNNSNPKKKSFILQELVINVDISSFDNVRSCCSGSDSCQNCWSLLSSSMTILSIVLKQNLGFTKTFITLNGLHGFSYWILDEKVRAYSQETRKKLFEYLDLRTIIKEPDYNPDNSPLSLQLLNSCEHNFFIFIFQGLHGFSSPKIKDEIKRIIGAELIIRIQEKLSRFENPESEEAWKKIKMMKLPHYRHFKDTSIFYRMIFSFTYPIIQINNDWEPKIAPFSIENNQIDFPVSSDFKDLYPSLWVPSVDDLVGGNEEALANFIEQSSLFFETVLS